MGRLLLLRHAKAGWAEPGMRDFDRPLTLRGRADAAAMGSAMRAAGHIPELVLCSTAKRARETWESVAATIGPMQAPPNFTERLYGANSPGYLSIIRNAAADVGSLLVIGHNPMMEDLAVALSKQGETDAMAGLAHGFPTSGMAAISFPGSLTEAAPGKGRLEAFLTPAML